jgi:hypothetical protein
MTCWRDDQSGSASQPGRDGGETIVGTLGSVLAVGLNGKPYYIHWGWFQISATNLIVIIAMILVLVAAIALPFPRRRR